MEQDVIRGQTTDILTNDAAHLKGTICFEMATQSWELYYFPDIRAFTMIVYTLNFLFHSATQYLCTHHFLHFAQLI